VPAKSASAMSDAAAVRIGIASAAYKGKKRSTHFCNQNATARRWLNS